MAWTDIAGKPCFSLFIAFPETNIAPENRPGPKRKRSSSNHQFSGAFAVSFREGSRYIGIILPSPTAKFTLPETNSTSTRNSIVVVTFLLGPGVRGRYELLVTKGGPLQVIDRIVTPISRVIAPVTYLFSAIYSGYYNSIYN